MVTPSAASSNAREMKAVQSKRRISRWVQALLFLLVVATGIAAAILIGQGSLLFTLAPAVMALAALGLPIARRLRRGFHRRRGVDNGCRDI